MPEDNITQIIENENRITGTPEDDITVGGDGNDLIGATDGVDVIDGGGGNNTLDFLEIELMIRIGGVPMDIDMVHGTYDLREGNNGDFSNIHNILGSKHGDNIDGDEGDNLLWGYHDRDIITGGGGDDRVFGGDGDDDLEGGDGNDRMSGNAGADVVKGGDGDDTIFGGGDGNGNADGEVDTLIGGNGDDVFILQDHDEVKGGEGIDTVSFEFAKEGVAVSLRNMEEVGNMAPHDDLDPNPDNTGGMMMGGGLNEELSSPDVPGDVPDGSQDIYAGSMDHGMGMDMGDDMDMDDIMDHGSMMPYDMSPQAHHGEEEGDEASEEEDTSDEDGYGDDEKEDDAEADNEEEDVSEGADDPLEDAEAEEDDAESESDTTEDMEDDEEDDSTASSDHGALWNIERVIGSQFADTIEGSFFNSREGADELLGMGGDDIINAKSGDDTIDGGEGKNTVNGHAGNDLFYINADDIADGGDGEDTASFEKWETGVTLSLRDNPLPEASTSGDAAGEEENTDDTPTETPPLDEIVDDIPDDASGITPAEMPAPILHHTDAGEFVIGGGGSHDTGTGNGNSEGSDGEDPGMVTFNGTMVNMEHIVGSAHNDILILSALSDKASGGEGDDVLEGGDGDDEMDGGAGNDRLRGNGGDNTYTGGDGADEFYATAGLGNKDIVTDFELGVDKVYLDGFSAASDMGADPTVDSDHISINEAEGNTYIEFRGDSGDVTSSIMLEGVLGFNAETDLVIVVDM